MFTEPKRDNGLKEPKMSYDTKKLWAIVKFNDFYEEITFKHFIKNIEHFIKIYEFEWEHDKYPNLGTAQNWYPKYDYNECVECYENYQLENSPRKAEKLWTKRVLNDTISDYKSVDDCNKNIKKLRQEPKPNVYAIAKEEETRDRIYNRIQGRLGKKKETREHTGNLGIQSENLNLNIQPSEEVLEENEDTFERFIERRLKKAPETTS